MGAIVTVVGRLGRDAEMRYMPGQNATPLVTFSLAVDQGWGDKKQTNWWPIEYFGTRAEKVLQYLTKGTLVEVTGRLEEQRWEKDGVKRPKTVVNVLELNLHGGGERETSTAQKPGTDGFQEAYDAGDEEEVVIPIV